MRIRTITSFFDPAENSDTTKVLERLSIFTHEAVQRFSHDCAEVQSTRLATTPFPTWLPVSDPEVAITAATELEVAASAAGFAYLGLGPALPEVPQSYSLLLPLLKATRNVFMGGIVAGEPASIHLAAVKACAKVIESAAGVTPDGFTNLRFAALANVGPYSPFFPAAYAAPGRPAFALALEAADVALEAFSKASSLAEARQRLLDELHRQTALVERVALELEGKYGIEFKGIDCSVAPFPEDWCSIGGALESLGLAGLGQHGSLAAAAFLADTLDRGSWRKVGFNGLMLPVLEDSVLAARSGNSLELKDLLLFSAVCGTGLDTVPLPGLVSAAQIAALLLDVAALSVRLNKPLTARLMPVPGKSAGEMTSFDFSYFSNGRLMDLEPGGLSGLLAQDEVFDIRPRRR
jgi:uncharacterized protein (UPF0210 family)